MGRLLDKYGYQSQESLYKKREKEIQKRDLEEDEVFERGLESLSHYLKKVQEKLQESNFPVTEDCRVNSESDFFRHISKEKKEKHLEKVKSLEVKLGITHNKEKTGEQLEMLKTALFDKFLGDKIFVLRSSKYDDYYNGIDNILIDKKTGEMVCAFDEVAFNDRSQDERLQEKKKDIYEKNVNCSGKLDYGFKFKNNSQEIQPSIIENIPVFYIYFPSKYLRKTIKEFNSNEKLNKKVFNTLIKELKVQADNECFIHNPPQGAKKRTVKIKRGWRTKLKVFSQILEKIN
jgi:hypothetical protein